MADEAAGDVLEGLEHRVGLAGLPDEGGEGGEIVGHGQAFGLGSGRRNRRLRDALGQDALRLEMQDEDEGDADQHFA